jgi:phosphoadenosine phosphosulfate reductase
MDEISSDTTKNTKLPINNLDLISGKMESKSAEEILRWALDTFAPRISLASSFGAEDVVLIHLMCGIDKANTKIFTLDTGRLNQETYDVMDQVRKKYGVTIDVFFPDSSSVEQMVSIKGMNLMYNSIEDRKQCCDIRKVKPLGRALRDLDCWITGIRREQSTTRSRIPKVEVDTVHNNIMKVNPLADWKSDQIWKFIKDNDVPFNKLHSVGYQSIGCAPCTRAVQPGEDPRAGRWWWETSSNKECGLHWELIRNQDKKDKSC